MEGRLQDWSAAASIVHFLYFKLYKAINLFIHMIQVINHLSKLTDFLHI